MPGASAMVSQRREIGTGLWCTGRSSGIPEWGRYHSQRHHGLLERIYCVWGTVSGGEARMFCKPYSSWALNCLAVPFNGCVTLTKL